MLSALIGPEEHRATKQTLGGPWDDGVAQWFGGSVSSSGVQVDNKTALNYSAVFRAVRVISGAISRLPIGVYRRTSDDTVERVKGHPVEWLLNTTVNGEIPSLVWRESRQAHLLTWGNCYSGIERNRAGQVISLVPKSPQGIHIERVAGRLVYEFKDDRGGTKTVAREDMLHIPGLGYDGIVGYDVIHMARECIGLGIAAENYGATFYGNSARPGGLLKHPGRISKEAAGRLRESWNNVHQGPNSQHKVGIVEEGMDWVPMSMPNDSAQFLETRKFQIVEIARWFDVAPHLLFELDRATFSNIEHQGLEFLIYSLAYWLARWEAFCGFSLFSEEEQRDGLILRHDASEILRADTKAMAEANKEAILGGWKTINQVLSEQHQPGIGPAGDMHLVQQQMVSVESIYAAAESAKNGENETKTEPEPLESQEEAAAQGKTAQTGLQGQQITALMAIIGEVTGGNLPKSAAKSMIRMSFPLIEASEVNSLVDALEIKPPEPLPAPVVAAQLPGQAQKRPAAAAPPQRAPQRPEMRSAAAAVLEDTLGRMVRREATHVKKAAESPKTFYSWMDDFYGKHEEIMREALSPAARVLTAATDASEQPEFRAWEIAKRHCSDSRQALLSAGDGNPDAFGERIDALLSTWTTSRVSETPELRSLTATEPEEAESCLTVTQ